ncbi:hypothetical protein [Methylobacterium sp. Leaf117]|uniref:hypothetical protein n=1 Tax=Methylobacterium sp. Leaf117 TaxID=1736260 RepID=UPI00138F85A0|nr:hypothetical protein [Methylobacterium sp. Leaf117]
MTKKISKKPTSPRSPKVSGDSCTIVVSHKLVKVEENKRKAVFRNPESKEYRITKVDNCVVTEGPRTDYLVSEKGSVSVLVELKGKDVEHACEQLFASADHASVRPLLESRIGFVIVCSKYPRFDTFVAKAKNTAAKRYKSGFHVICDQRELDIIRAVAIDGPY